LQLSVILVNHLCWLIFFVPSLCREKCTVIIRITNFVTVLLQVSPLEIVKVRWLFSRRKFLTAVILHRRLHRKYGFSSPLEVLTIFNVIELSCRVQRYEIIRTALIRMFRKSPETLQRYTSDKFLKKVHRWICGAES